MQALIKKRFDNFEQFLGDASDTFSKHEVEKKETDDRILLKVICRSTGYRPKPSNTRSLCEAPYEMAD